MRTNRSVLALAITGAILIASSAFALDGTAPVDVSNGTAKIECATSNSVVVDAAGTVSCSDVIPLGVSTSRFSLVEKVALYGVAQYDTVGCGGVLGLSYSLDVIYTPTSFCGCAYSAAAATPDPFVIYAAGEALCSKTSAAIALGDRVTLDSTNGYLKTAADSEVAVGVAVTAAASGATEVRVMLGQRSSPVALPTKYVQFVTAEGVLPAGSSDRWMAPTINGDLEASYHQNTTSVSWTAGAISNGLSCECDTAVATSRSMDVLLCNDSSNCTTSNHVSFCELNAGGSSCVDSTFSEVATSSGDDLFMFFTRYGGTGVGCQRVSCKFAWTQTEY